jgi:hypothetical protein
MLKIKDIKNPTDKELEIIIKEVQNDEIKMCNYCKYNNDCIGCVTCYGNEPVFPPCADIEYKELFDYDQYIEEVSNEKI